jgi:hypothetical protein
MRRTAALLLAGALCASQAPAALIVDYTVDLGGDNGQPLNGLSARAIFEIDATTLSILLINTSTGVPAGFDASDQLLVSLGLNLPGDVTFLSGDTAMIGPGSSGVGSWADRSAGDSIAEQWVWTNNFGGDLLEDSRQVISTSRGLGDPPSFGFGGHEENVAGPFGGIAAAPPLRSINANQPAASDSIEFELTLTQPLTESQLAAAVRSSVVEFGSDQRYLGVPEPASIGLVAIMLAAASRRRR